MMEFWGTCGPVLTAGLAIVGAGDALITLACVTLSARQIAQARRMAREAHDTLASVAARIAREARAARSERMRAERAARRAVGRGRDPPP